MVLSFFVRQARIWLVDVARWLTEQGLGHHAELFADNGIAGDVLRDLTDADLRELGVNLGDRKRLLKAIAGLGAALTPDEADTTELNLPPTPPREAERRQLTVMFVDLVSSTTLSQKLDPEEMREVICSYQLTVAGEVSRYDGHVAKYMGDGVLVYFGWPAAHEDDAERAVRAGLAITERVAQLEGGGARLGCRVGVATGLVVVGDLVGQGVAQEQAVVGETPNLAARLQTVAPVDGLIISATTARLLGCLFDLERVKALELKGIEAGVTAFRVISEGQSEGRFDALHGGRLTPLVGRDHELGLLLDRWSRVKDGEGQVVLLSGEPGIGKSRLIQGLRERLCDEKYMPLPHHGSAHHSSSAFHPIVRHLERAAGLARDDPAEIRLDKLEALLKPSSDDLSGAMHLIAALFDLDVAGRYPVPDLAPQRRKRLTLEALVGQVEVLARTQPVLAIYEDAQWFDSSTLEAIGLLVDRTAALRVLVLIAFRPDFVPPWRSHGNITSLSLSRLARRDGTNIVARLTGGRPLPPELEEQLLARTDGIPLFVEELTKVVLESGLLEEAGHQYALKGPLPPLAIPASLQDSLMARLDRLAPVKEVAQVASVIGREFPFSLLCMVAEQQDEELCAALQQLEEAELVYRRGLPPDATYTFKHALVQDAAYQSLLKAKRQQLHARIASALSELGTAPQVLAHHYAEAGLLEPAICSWAEAGQEALARSAMREAVKAFWNALDLVRKQPPSVERRRRELDLLAPLSVALINTSGPGSADVEKVQREAAVLAAGLGDREGEFRAKWLLWRVHNVRAELEQAVGVARPLWHNARRDGNRHRQLHALHALWSSSLFRGDLRATVRHVEDALKLYDPALHSSSAMVLGGHDAKECGLTNGGNALLLLGYPEKALAWNRAGLDHAQEVGHPQVVVHALNWNIILPQLLDDLEDIRARLDIAAPLIENNGLSMYYAEARILEAWLAVRCNNDRRAVKLMREHLERRSAMGTTFVQTYFSTLIADAWLRIGEPTEAMATLQDGIEAARATGEHFFSAELFRLSGRARLALDARDVAGAQADLNQALTDARGRRARLWELRAARDLARLCAEQGERQEAYDLLAPIYGWFTEGFETQDLRDAKSLLDELL